MTDDSVPPEIDDLLLGIPRRIIELHLDKRKGREVKKREVPPAFPMSFGVCH
jgi:hypothetical protein